MNCNKTVDGCKCSSCNDGFYLSNYQCLQCDSNCATCYGIATNCTSCNNGLYLNSEKSCDNCTIPCKTCSSKTICNSCIENYFLVSDNCYQCNINCKSTIDGCQCESCYDGYFLSNSQCFQCTDPNCKTCIDSADNCSICNDDFYLDSNNHSCLRCPKPCYSCSNETICNYCKYEYNDTCYPKCP